MSRHYSKLVVDRSLQAALVIMYCDRQLTGHDQTTVENNGYCSRAFCRVQVQCSAMEQSLIYVRRPASKCFKLACMQCSRLPIDHNLPQAYGRAGVDWTAAGRKCFLQASEVMM